MAVMYIGKNKIAFGGGSVTSDGKVKLNETTELQYLESYLDNSTIQIIDNKIVAKSLDGLNLTITELNDLKDKLDTIVMGGMSYEGLVNTKAELDALIDAEKGYLKIVLQDEENANKKMTYIYDGTKWESLGEFKLEIRDFDNEPLNLETEVTGKLPQANMDLEGLVKEDDLADYLDKTTYDTNNNGIIDKAETLEGLTKTIDELNKSLVPDSIIEGDNIKIVNNGDGTITISSTATGSGTSDLEIDDNSPNKDKVYSSYKVQSIVDEKVSIDSIIAGDNIEIEKDDVNNTVTIKSTASGGGINLKSLPTFGI